MKIKKEVGFYRSSMERDKRRNEYSNDNVESQSSAHSLRATTLAENDDDIKSKIQSACDSTLLVQQPSEAATGAPSPAQVTNQRTTIRKLLPNTRPR